MTPKPSGCTCEREHYPLEFFAGGRYGGAFLATRGTKPVENVLAQGWKRADPEPRIKRQLREQYDRSHRYDWLHTPTYLDDRETHLRMKAETAR